MNLVVWLVVGGVMGCVASLLMRTDGRQTVVMNVVVGVTGALAGGWFLSPLLGGSRIDQVDFSAVGLLAGFGGAAVMLAGATLVWRKTAN